MITERLAWLLSRTKAFLKRIASPFIYLGEDEGRGSAPTYMAFVSPQKKEVIDIIDSQTGCGAYSGKNLDQFKAEFPDVTIMDKAAANKMFDEMCITEPREISREEWAKRMNGDMVRELLTLGNLDQASFKSANNFRGSVTMCYVRVSGRCFCFYDLEHLSHAKLIQKVQAHIFESRLVDIDLDDEQSMMDTVPSSALDYPPQATSS